MNEKNELKEFISLYIDNEWRSNNVSCNDEISDILNNYITFEKPDAYYIKENTLYIIEHFRFDSSVHFKNSSSILKSEGTFRKNAKLSNNIIYTERVNYETSNNEYIDNYKRSFNEHYEKIKSYVEHIKSEINIEDNHIIKIVFVCEDTSPYGTTIHQNPIYPVNIKELNSIIVNSKIDYFIFSNQNNFVLIHDNKIKSNYKFIDEKEEFDKYEYGLNIAAKIEYNKQ